MTRPSAFSVLAPLGMADSDRYQEQADVKSWAAFLDLLDETL